MHVSFVFIVSLSDISKTCDCASHRTVIVNPQQQAMSSNIKKIWIVRNEGEQPTKMPVDFAQTQDLDDLKELMFGPIDKALYTGHFNGIELAPDANIPPNTSAQNSLIFKKAKPIPASESTGTRPSTPPPNEVPSQQHGGTRPATTLLQNALLLTPEQNGRPSFHKLKTDDVSTDTQRKLRKRQINIQNYVPPQNIPEKVLMVIGATGAGKSTTINALANHYYGVKWQDNFRFKLINEDDEGINGQRRSQSGSQTKWITAYSLTHLEGCAIPNCLTIVDTPGFGDAEGIERDKQITEQMREFFSASNTHGIDQIDAIGFVVRSSDCILTPTQRYIFDSVLSIFGKNVQGNIFILITFSDGQVPPALTAIRDAQVPFEESFKLNNSALYARNQLNNDDESEDNFDPMFWKMGERNVTKFLVKLQQVQPVSLTLTNSVLAERKRLQAIIAGIQPQIQLGLGKLEELRQEVDLLKKHVNDILRNKDFEFTVTKPKFDLIQIPVGTYVTNCLICNRTCHYPCGIPDDGAKHGCSAMDGGGENAARCVVCPGKCSWRDHKNMPYRIDIGTETKTTTIEDMKTRFLAAEGKTTNSKQTVKTRKDEFLQTQQSIVDQINEARQAIQRLNNIALKPKIVSVADYIDILIESEKQSCNPGYQERIKHLNIAKQNAKILEEMQGSNGSGSLEFFGDSAELLVTFEKIDEVMSANLTHEQLCTKISEIFS